MLRLKNGYEKNAKNQDDLSPIIIPDEQLVVLEEIGRGQQSKVFKGKKYDGHKETMVAVKQLIVKPNQKLEDLNRNVLEEIRSQIKFQKTI